MNNADLRISSIVEMTLQHALDVIESCRPSDVKAWQPFYFFDSDQEFAVNRWSTQGVKKTLVNRYGDPVAIGGLSLSMPGTWTAWFVATPGWQAHAKSMIKFSRSLLEAMFERGDAKRIQAWVRADDQTALTFATQCMGFEVEHLCEQLASGQDFYQIRRLR